MDESPYLWECTIVVTRFFKVVLAIFDAARDTKVKSADKKTNMEGADLTWSNLANNLEEREKQKE